MPPAAAHVAGPGMHHSTHGGAAPLYSALLWFKISQADTQWYNEILVFESLDLKGKIPCKSHAAEMQHVRRLCLAGTLRLNRCHPEKPLFGVCIQAFQFGLTFPV